MQIKVTLLLTSLFFLSKVFAQDRTYTIPDYAQIEKATTDKNSNFYYPKLMARYMANDTTMTKAEIQMIYYGRFFNESTDTLSDAEKTYHDSTKYIYSKEKLDDNDRRNLIRYYSADYRIYPTGLKSINSLYSLYRKLNDPRARYYYFKLKSLCTVIFATGDGKSSTSGFHVNCIPDEYALLAILGFDFGGKQSLIDRSDYLEVAENKYDIKGIYFDVSQIFKGYEKAFKNVDFSKTLKELEKSKAKKKD